MQSLSACSVIQVFKPFQAIGIFSDSRLRKPMVDPGRKKIEETKKRTGTQKRCEGKSLMFNMPKCYLSYPWGEMNSTLKLRKLWPQAVAPSGVCCQRTCLRKKTHKMETELRWSWAPGQKSACFNASVEGKHMLWSIYSVEALKLQSLKKAKQECWKSIHAMN